MVPVAYGIGNTGKREASGKLHHILLELLDEFGSFASTGLVSFDKVLEEFRTSLFLGLERDLDYAVKELGDLL